MSFYPRPRPFHLGTVPDGDEGIKATLLTMVALARQYQKDPGVRQLAAQLVAPLDQYDRLGEVKALHAFVRDSIRYTNDPVYTELVQTPPATLQMGVGDCDDKALLLATLLESIGRPARFRAVAIAPHPELSHVLVEARIGKGWLPLETIEPVEAGWFPAGVTRSMFAHV
jgi:transglutaminase-like putative cysteine protease